MGARERASLERTRWKIGNGEGGIRTHGDLHLTAFREPHHRPLGHLSVLRETLPTCTQVKQETPPVIVLAPTVRTRADLFLSTRYGVGGNRTPDALLRTEALYPLSYNPDHRQILPPGGCPEPIENCIGNAPLPKQEGRL
jgi:hypothetical protein